MLELAHLEPFALATPLGDVERFIEEANVALDSAKAFEVTDADSFEDAGKIAGRVKSIEKRIEELTEPAIKAAHEKHRSLTAARGAILNKLNGARNALNKRALDWRAEQLRREQEEQRERERVAREQAEAERKRIEEERLRAAIEAEQSGDKATAEAILSAPAPVVAPVAIAARTEVPKATGASIRTVYEFEITDAAILPREFLEPCLPAIRARVNAMGVEAHIPGVKVTAKAAMSNRAA